MSLHSKVTTFVQLAYSIVAMPALIVTSKVAPAAHRVLCRPLTSGPLDGKLIENIWTLIYSLQDRQIDDESFIASVGLCMKESFDSGELAEVMALADEKSEDVDVVLKRCLGFLPLKWWYLKLHFMTPNNVHQLHNHRTAISAQVIVRGRLDAEQYNIVGCSGEDIVHLDPVPVSDADGCQILLATNKHCNVHGFRPREPGVVRFQFYLRGHDTLLGRIPKRGRRYVALTGETTSDGYIVGRLGDAGRFGES